MMEVLSVAAGVVGLLDVACRSSTYIIRLMQRVGDDVPAIQRHRAYVYALLGTLSQLQLICNGVNLRQCDRTRLSSNIEECLVDIRDLEKWISKTHYKLNSGGKLQNVRAMLDLARSNRLSYPDNVSNRILMWNSILISDLLIIQSTSLIELNTAGARSGAALQNLHPPMVRLNDQLDDPRPEQRMKYQSQSSQQLQSSNFNHFLQTALRPKAVSGKHQYRFEIRSIQVILRIGPIIVQKWTASGEEAYQTLRAGNGCGVDVIIQAPCVSQARISLFLFFMAGIPDYWTGSASYRITSQNVVSEHARAVKAVVDGDLTLLQQLFDSRQASPIDTLQNGQGLIHIAASGNRLAVVKLLLEQGAAVNVTTNSGDTALHLAVRYKADYDVARILIEKGADLESYNTYKQTPLHTFFSPMIPLLAQRHGSFTSSSSKDARGMNLAHYFSWTNSSTLADFQKLSQVDTLLGVPDAVGRTAIHLASQRGNISVIRYLLAKGVGLSNVPTDNRGNTPVHEAVLSPRAPQAIELLLSHGFDVNAVNSKNHTPLQHAAMWGTVPALSYLLQRNPAGIAWRDAQGRGLLALARRTENRRVAAWLETEYGELVEAGGKVQDKKVGSIDWRQRITKILTSRWRSRRVLMVQIIVGLLLMFWYQRVLLL